MSREELIEKMLDGYHGAGIKAAATFAPWGNDYKDRMAAALDVAVGELLGEIRGDEWSTAACDYAEGDFERHADGKCYLDRATVSAILRDRRSRYLKPKSDPAVEAVEKMFVKDCTGAWCMTASAKEIVAAVRNADKSLA